MQVRTVDAVSAVPALVVISALRPELELKPLPGDHRGRNCRVGRGPLTGCGAGYAAMKASQCSSGSPE
jgi:hypothetical protein